MTDWTGMTAAALGRAIEAGEVDPIALTEAYLDAIAAQPDADRIYARTTPERAMDEAAAAHDRARAGRRRSPLDGVPISWKDLVDSAGTATEAGTKLLEGRVPDHDAPVLATATAMGLVCLGKTHLSELAFSGLGLNPVTATAPNINDPEAVPGGSSSGAAASVAFGLAAGAIGSDTGGSVRIPAAWNDLVGLKTTAGRIDMAGCVPLCARFDTIGPLARTVEDAALLLAAIAGRAAPDLRGADRVEGLHFAVLQTIVMDDIRPEPAAAQDAALERLKAAGARLTDVAAPEIEGPMAASPVLYPTEAWATWGAVIEEQGDVMFPPIRDRFAAGASTSGAAFEAAWRDVHAARAMWADRMAGFDAVLMPAAANLPPKAARLMTDTDYYVTENLLTLRNTRVGNLMGTCAVTIPVPGHPSCGLMAVGTAGGEDRLLRAAVGIEAALAR